jgi:hypothetical protein
VIVLVVVVVIVVVPIFFQDPSDPAFMYTFISRSKQYNVILNLVVCILLRVLDQVQGFPSNP